MGIESVRKLEKTDQQIELNSIKLLLTYKGSSHKCKVVAWKHGGVEV
jgi:hypothetical protein